MADTNLPHSPRSQRLFNDPVNSPYILPVDTEEGRRLDLQYEAIKDSAGGKRILAPVELSPGDHVLDCATGTGVWLLDIASVSPTTVSFYGIDISPHLFPPSASTPPNVSFSQYSVLDPMPGFSSSFALINQRLLTGALRATEWSAALRKHFEMLHPGGWPQLCEIDAAGFSRPDGACTARMHDMLARLFTARGLDLGCALRLEGWARAAGFVNATTLRTRGPVGSRGVGAAGESEEPHKFTKPLLDSFMAVKESMLNSGIIGSEEEYEEALRDLEAEWNLTKWMTPTIPLSGSGPRSRL